MSRILACLDDSPYSVGICDLAAWAAVRLGWEVELLHVLQRKSAVTARHDLSGAIGLGVKSNLLEELTRIDELQGKLAIEKGQALLRAAEQRLRDASVVGIAVRHRHGGIVETILEREAEAGLLVMGKRGASSEFAAAHLGSKIERVLRASTKPMLIAPLSLATPARVLIAYDGGKSAKRAVELVRQSPLFSGLPIHVLMAGGDSTENEEALVRVAEALAQSGATVTTELRAGAAEAVIARATAERPGSLLIMGAHGHSPLRHLIIGSTTMATIRLVEAPVLLVR